MRGEQKKNGRGKPGPRKIHSHRRHLVWGPLAEERGQKGAPPADVRPLLMC